MRTHVADAAGEEEDRDEPQRGREHREPERPWNMTSATRYWALPCSRNPPMIQPTVYSAGRTAEDAEGDQRRVAHRLRERSVVVAAPRRGRPRSGRPPGLGLDRLAPLADGVPPFGQPRGRRQAAPSRRRASGRRRRPRSGRRRRVRLSRLQRSGASASLDLVRPTARRGPVSGGKQAPSAVDAVAASVEPARAGCLALELVDDTVGGHCP